MGKPLPSFIERFSDLAPDYDVLLCDVWGVVHNGVAAFPEACDALARFRAGGGTVVLVTNAPRPGEGVQRILDRFGVQREAYDGITSSGDVTRSIIASRRGERVFHLGPERDVPMFTGLDAQRSPLETADYVVCSGLFDDTTETPESYRGMLTTMRERALFMVCANPDIVVERGATLVYCAGAIAELYLTLGGEVLFCGKPHAPIYEAALAKAAAARGRCDAACARSRDRGFGAHRSLRRCRIRARLPVRHRRNPRRRARPPRSAGPQGAGRYFRGGRRYAESRHAPSGVVIPIPIIPARAEI